MGSSAFDDFVRREQTSARESEEEAVDWLEEKKRWLRHLDELFSQIREYLEPYVDDGQIAIEFEKIELNEESIGPYVAPVMVIRIGRKTIKLEPVGTLLIGSKGAVDIIGPTARARLMLLNSKLTSLSQLFHVTGGVVGKMPAPPRASSPSQIEWAWRIVTRPPGREIAEVNKDTFLNLLLESANG
jgi:hypothetical protein